MKKIAITMMTTALISITTISVAHANDAHNGAHGSAHTATQQAQSEKLIQATGIITQIDLTNSKVTIAHEAIPSIGWPEMVMRFTANDVALIENLSVNDRVSFVFSQQGALSVLDSITVID